MCRIPLIIVVQIMKATEKVIIHMFHIFQLLGDSVWHCRSCAAQGLSAVQCSGAPRWNVPTRTCCLRQDQGVPTVQYRTK